MTKGNEEGRYIGTTDESLSEKGINEIKKRRYPECDIVISSPMKRCIETAHLIYSDKNIEICNNFKECDFGDFENRNYHELSRNGAYQAWIDSNGTLPFPNGESREAFIKRCVDGFYEVKEKYRDKTVALVVHGGTIMAILSVILGGEYYNYHIDNGEYIEREL